MCIDGVQKNAEGYGESRWMGILVDRGCFLRGLEHWGYVCRGLELWRYLGFRSLTVQSLRRLAVWRVLFGMLHGPESVK